MYGIVNLTRIDTTPGAGGAFAPQAGFDGDYRDFMRRRWVADPGARQHIAVVGRLLAGGQGVGFIGPYAEEARRIALAVQEGP